MILSKHTGKRGSRKNLWMFRAVRCMINYVRNVEQDRGFLMETVATTERKRVLLLMSPATYRAGAFLSAAQRLNLEVVVGIDLPETLADYWHVPLGIDFTHIADSVQTIMEFAQKHPLHAILSVDDAASELAAHASVALGLAHNSPQAAEAARDKLLMRKLMAAGGAPCPVFRDFSLHGDPAWIATQVTYPCVLKPLRLSGSRGVIRANHPAEFIAAFHRLKRLLMSEGYKENETSFLVEDFIPGFEVALEGLLTQGKLEVLALFDKPDPLVGPFFEETIYVTPSRLPAATQRLIAATAEHAAAALGLRNGPLHAELRINDEGAWPVDIAARSIGGLCSRTLSFGTGMSLEELILRHALGFEIPSTNREASASGVMMIPIPARGVLRDVHGVSEAEAVPGIVDVTISILRGQPVVPLPEGSEYLGFIFARGDSPEFVEQALRRAHVKLRFDIEP